MTRKPILNGILQSDLAGAGFAGTDFGGLEIGYRTTKEIYLGQRTSGKAGSGSKIDPFDCTTRLQFDTKMASLDPAVKWIVHVDDNEFLTYGKTLWALTPGIQFVGNGKANSVIKLDPGVVAAFPGLYTYNVFQTNDANNDGTLVEGITVDANWTAMEIAGAIGGVAGVYLYGDNCSVRNVKVINTNGIFPIVESFAILIVNNLTGSPKSCRNALIEYCEAEQFYGNYHSAIVIAGGSGFISDYGYAQGGKLLNCMVRSDYVPADLPTFGHLLAFANDGGVTANCFSYGTLIGFRNEQGKDVVVKDCGFFDVRQIGVDLPGTLNKGTKVTRCTVEMRDDHLAQCYGFQFYGDVPGVGNHIYSQNTLRLKVTGNTPGNPEQRYSFVSAPSLEEGHGNMILNNIVDDGFKAQFPPDTVVFGNIHPDGTSVPEIPNSSNLSRPDNENSALVGSMLMRTLFNEVNGRVQYYLDAGSYEIEAGDIYAFEIFCSESNETFAPYVRLEFDDLTTSGDLVDQHGLFLAHDDNSVHDPDDLSDYAKGRWYRRFATLDDYAGMVVDRFSVGDIPGTTGTNYFYFRNARIIKSDGSTARTFIAPDQPIFPLLAAPAFHVSAYSFDIVPSRAFIPIAEASAQIAANKNNYAIGNASTYIFRINSDANRSISGLSFSPNQADGQTHIIINVGIHDIGLINQGGGSIVGNQFLTTTGSDITLTPGQQAMVIYDADVSSFRTSKMN